MCQSSCNNPFKNFRLFVELIDNSFEGVIGAFRHDDIAIVAYINALKFESSVFRYLKLIIILFSLLVMVRLQN
ncbi:hypothetical protein LH22_14375 [Pantoea rwandensis]|uniref:Uncharacterized protein n=1 Tax=Pantoea rwandensis TaxID=1076550 RepID=A0ABM5RLB7_9GAMM|nr:hypothetical protein LH22_14375 [Pantoea rwandensis]